MGAVDILTRAFPGRLTIVRGNSIKTVPRWRNATRDARCDLVHVDGLHSYLNTLADFINLRLQAPDHALYLFDDQCDATNCNTVNARSALEPGSEFEPGRVLEPGLVFEASAARFSE